MKGKQRKLGTESCLSASDESGNWGGITVYSIQFTKAVVKNIYLIVQTQDSSPYNISIPDLYIAPNFNSS